jgi:acetolactate synthase-1/2/3 large subunit
MWRFGNVDFAKVAEVMGCVGMRVERPEQIAPALKEALKMNRPVVIDAVSDARAFARKAWVPA